jgi:hypothetical protein
LTSPTTGTVSVYRRPLPATNLNFESTLMADGREPNLTSQATDATLIHAQAAAAPSTEQLTEITDFETGTFTAQSLDKKAGDLTSTPVSGGPVALSTQNFYTGINDPFGNDPSDPSGASFNPDIFDVFKGWESLNGKGAVNKARESIGRGEIVFNTFKFNISGVAGLNDVLGQSSIPGTCGTCHDTPNFGNRSIDGTLEIGTDLTDDSVIDFSGLPLFNITCTAGPLSGQTYQTTDPGRALITGQCADIGKVKVEGLRGLAARAPYFHNGSAATLADVITHYEHIFQITPMFSKQQMTDLINFLNAL